MMVKVVIRVMAHCGSKGHEELVGLERSSIYRLGGFDSSGTTK